MGCFFTTLPFGDWSLGVVRSIAFCRNFLYFPIDHLVFEADSSILSTIRHDILRMAGSDALTALWFSGVWRSVFALLSDKRRLYDLCIPLRFFALMHAPERMVGTRPSVFELSQFLW